MVATAVAVRQQRRRLGFWGLVILRGPALTRVGLVSPSISLSLPLPLYLSLSPSPSSSPSPFLLLFVPFARRVEEGGEKGGVGGGSGPGGASIDLTAHSSASTTVEGRRRRLKGWVRCQHAYIQSSPTLVLLAGLLYALSPTLSPLNKLSTAWCMNRPDARLNVILEFIGPI